MKVTIVRGLPGSGKSTLGRKISAESGAVLLEQDMLRIRDGEYVFNYEDDIKDAFLDTIRSFARFGADLVLTGVFATRKSIEEALWSCNARPFGCEISVRIIHCKNDFGTEHNVPKHIIRSMRDSWEPYGESTINGFISLEEKYLKLN